MTGSALTVVAGFEPLDAPGTAAPVAAFLVAVAPAAVTVTFVSAVVEVFEPPVVVFAELVLDEASEPPEVVPFVAVVVFDLETLEVWLLAEAVFPPGTGLDFS